MPIDINLLDVFGRVRDRTAGTYTGPPLPDDPVLQYRYLHARRQNITGANAQRPLLRLWDKHMNYVGQIAQERSVRVEEVMADTGGGTCVIRRDNWLSNFILYD